MRIFRNIALIFILLVLLIINSALFTQHFYHPTFYIAILDSLVAIIIVFDIIHGIFTEEKIRSLEKENEKLKLAISDYTVESTLLYTLIDIIEGMGEPINLNNMLDKVTDSLKNIFKDETVILQFFGERFVKVVKGRDIDLPSEIFEDTVLKGTPSLVNNPGSFERYKKVSEKGITSFLIVPLKIKENVNGILGLFSFKNKIFTSKELDLLRIVAVPISLLVENAELFEKTKLLSITDSLTQLYNRRHFEELLSQYVEKAKKENTHLSLAICDIDFFKFYNDANGHLAGDMVLKEIANLLKKGVKGSDIVARFGGEEFIIIFPNTIKENAVKVCESLRRSIKEYKFPNEEKQPNKDLTVSIGVATFPEDAKDPEELIKKADICLYKAKNCGRDRVVAD